MMSIYVECFLCEKTVDPNDRESTLELIFSLKGTTGTIAFYCCRGCAEESAKEFVGKKFWSLVKESVRLQEVKE